MINQSILDGMRFFALKTVNKSSQEGNFITSKATSQTIEVESLLNNSQWLKIICGLLELECPENITIEQALNIRLLAELKNLGRYISGDILRKFPDEVPVYFDFRQIEIDKKHQFTTDDGRFLWTISEEKWDIRITCESRNRYEFN